MDIEDQANDMGDLDIENFPTLFIQRRESVLSFGTMLPHLHLLHRLIENFHEQSYEESQSYAWASPERVSWQENKGSWPLAEGRSTVDDRAAIRSMRSRQPGG